jgi:putative transposase
VTRKAKRPRFSAAEKARILQEADARERGELGALLRREGLNSSRLVEWRRAREAGELAGLTPRKRGPKAEATDAPAAKVAEQQKPIARRDVENAKLRPICDVQKKTLSALARDPRDGSERRREQLEVLMAHGGVRGRRNQLRHMNRPRPELLATEPNELWSWEIMKLKRSGRASVSTSCSTSSAATSSGWMVASEESATLAKKLLAETYRHEDIDPAQLTLHAGRGRAMTSTSFALLLADLGVTKPHSRPHVSNEIRSPSPPSRPLKYRPGFPDRFGREQDARAHCRDFFDHEHRHGALALCTPHDVHRGVDAQVYDRRATVLDTAFLAHPDRFTRGRPLTPSLPTAMWINKPNAGVPIEDAAR